MGNTNSAVRTRGAVGIATATCVVGVLTLGACGAPEQPAPNGDGTTPVGVVADEDEGTGLGVAARTKEFPAKVAINGRKDKGDAANAPGHKFDAYEKGEMVPVKCQSSVGSEIWDYTADGWWVPDRYVTTGYDGYTPGVARCDGGDDDGGGDARVKAAVAFAEKRLGATDWNNECELFVERAYGTSGKFASAKTHYQWQKSQGRIKTGSTPPAGAAVFFTSTSQYGHVMLSVGGNKAISTGPKVYQTDSFRDRDDYLGWAYVPSSW